MLRRAWQTLRAALTLVGYRLDRRRFRRAERRSVTLRYQDHDVLIERDVRGIPTITSTTPAGVYFGQGYAAARDRLWQMDVLRRTGAGRLSELFGAATLPFDAYHRTLGLNGVAGATLAAMAAGDTRLLAAFTAGINFAIERSLRKPLDLPVEFRLLQYRPEPWRAEDTIVLVKLMSLRLAMNVKYKALMHELLKELPLEQVRAIAAECGCGDFVTLSNAPSQFAAPAPGLQVRQHSLDLMPLLRVLGHASATGSNGFVIAGCHTANGRPLLANDPHLPFGLPAALHQSHLCCTDPQDPFEAVGVNVPGLPGIISGHNRQVAWGITNSQVDVQDLALLAADSSPGLQLFRPAAYTEEVRVRGADPRRCEVRLTALGPSLGALCGNTAPDPDIVLMWSGLTPGSDIAGLFQLTKARDWRSFRTGLAQLHSLSLNFIFAAVDGDIAFKTVGRVPLRAAGLQHAPAPASWHGFVAFDALPELHNPASGIIVTANNPITDNGATDTPILTTLWNPDYRARRLFTLLNGRSGLTAEDLERAQHDVLNLHARELLPGLLELLVPQEPAQQAAFEVLRAWDYHEHADAPAPLLWQRFFERLAADIYGAKFQRFMPFFEHRIIATTRQLRQVLAGGTTAWLNGREALARLANHAFAAVVATLPATQSWGVHHQLGFRHLMSGALGALRTWVDVPSAPRHGSNLTVALNSGHPRIVEGAVWRLVVEFSAAQCSSRSLLLPGQSGDFRSRWYADQFVESASRGQLVSTHRLPGQVGDSDASATGAITAAASDRALPKMRAAP